MGVTSAPRRLQLAHAHRRAVATLLAGGVVLAQLLALWHVVAERHHWCAEHRGVCEDDAGAATPASERIERSTLAAPSPVLSTAPDEHADHHACALASVHLSSVLGDAGVRLHADVSTTLAGAVASRAAPRSAVALFRLAPKTSPPRA